jgi:acyl-CoA synthetase (AMP-forming)/AMP-acid ligase II
VSAGHPGQCGDALSCSRGRERTRLGEVVVRGGHVMLGYWNKPEETAAAVRDGWMHTGDGACIDDEGYVYIVDRIKDMIVSGGENVYSAEVENAIAKHPAVAACAVIGVPDDNWGGRVHAVVVLRTGAQARQQEISDHVPNASSARSTGMTPTGRCTETPRMNRPDTTA